MGLLSQEIASTLRQAWKLPECIQLDSLSNAGGFSGAAFWRVHLTEETYCLRRWPSEHPTPEHLAWIHAVLQHVGSRSSLPLALPMPTTYGQTFVQYAGHLWELTHWLPGKPYPFFPEPVPSIVSGFPSGEIVTSDQALVASHLISAMSALALFHQAAESCPGPQSRIGISPSLTARATKIQELLAPGQVARLRDQILSRHDWPECAAAALEILQIFPHVAAGVLQRVVAVKQLEVPLQPCIRDIWSDHLLFQAGELSGWVDFGAMRIETVAADIARLLGSIAGDIAARWELGLQAYDSIRPLASPERRLVPVFDASQTLLAGMNWIEWIFAQDRRFEQPVTIQRRLQTLLVRLRQLAKTLS